MFLSSNIKTLFNNFFKDQYSKINVRNDILIKRKAIIIINVAYFLFGNASQTTFQYKYAEIDSVLNPERSATGLDTPIIIVGRKLKYMMDVFSYKEIEFKSRVNEYNGRNYTKLSFWGASKIDNEEGGGFA